MKIIKKLYDSTKWSLSGLVYAYKSELAFRLEVFAILVLTPLAIYLATDLNQFLWLFISIHLVVVAELINTAIEATVDMISKKHNMLAKHAKDVASAVVFYTIILAIIIWTVILYQIFNQ